MAVPIVLALLQEEERQTYETTLQVDEMEVADVAPNIIHSMKAAAVIQRFLRVSLNPTWLLSALHCSSSALRESTSLLAKKRSALSGHLDLTD